MGTEEDTFDRLRKPSFNEMLALVNAAHPTWWMDLFHSTDRDYIYSSYFKSYNWTVDEWWEVYIDESIDKE